MQIESLQRLLSQGAEERATGFKQITIGVSNEAYTVTCASGNRYVIRVIHLQTAESVRAEALIQRVMAKHGISTPLYLRLTGGEFVGHDGVETFTIARYVSGKHPEQPSLKLVRSLGAVMARLHTILHQDEIAIGYNSGQWLHPRNVATNIAGCDTATRKLLRPVIGDTLHIFDKGLPMAIIHGELAAHNIFAKDDEVTTVFDFETTEYAPRILDVAYSYLSFVYDENLEPAAVLTALEAGYNTEAETKLTAEENASFDTALRYVSVATASWCFSRDYDEYGKKFLRAGGLSRQ